MVLSPPLEGYSNPWRRINFGPVVECGHASQHPEALQLQKSGASSRPRPARRGSTEAATEMHISVLHASSSSSGITTWVDLFFIEDSHGGELTLDRSKSNIQRGINDRTHQGVPTEQCNVAASSCAEFKMGLFSGALQCFFGRIVCELVLPFSSHSGSRVRRMDPGAMLMTFPSFRPNIVLDLFSEISQKSSSTSAAVDYEA